MVVAFGFPVNLVESYRFSYHKGEDPIAALQAAGVPIVAVGRGAYGCEFNIGSGRCTVTLIHMPDENHVKYTLSFFTGSRDCFGDVLATVAGISRPFLFVSDQEKKLELVSLLGLN